MLREQAEFLRSFERFIGICHTCHVCILFLDQLYHSIQNRCLQFLLQSNGG